MFKYQIPSLLSGPSNNLKDLSKTHNKIWNYSCGNAVDKNKKLIDVTSCYHFYFRLSYQ